MFNKILVAIDRSAASKEVFNKALSLAKADGGCLILLHVLSVEESDSPFMSPYLMHYPLPISLRIKMIRGR